MTETRYNLRSQALKKISQEDSPLSPVETVIQGTIKILPLQLCLSFWEKFRVDSSMLVWVYTLISNVQKNLPEVKNKP